ncbi:hypothetical protein [Acinetobacter colistiniresistens]|nr:hypothetical protein [Acinetobacter colistiniresistens]
MFSNKVSSALIMIILHGISAHAAWRRVCISLQGDFAPIHPMTS